MESPSGKPQALAHASIQTSRVSLEMLAPTEAASADRKSLLSRSATIPCLGLVAHGLRTRGEILEATRRRFAPRTVTDSLELLAELGLIEATREQGKGRRFEYSLTRAGAHILSLTVSELAVHALHPGEGGAGPAAGQP